MIPIYWTEQATIRNLPELLAKYRQHGGKIVEYQEVISLVVFTQRRPVFVWVPPGKTPRAAGIPHALGCLLVGWWSFFGFFWTPAAIVNNLMGGVDLTQVLTGPPPLPGQPYHTTALYQLRKAKLRQQIVTWSFAVAVIAAVVVLVIFPVAKRLQ